MRRDNCRKPREFRAKSSSKRGVDPWFSKALDELRARRFRRAGRANHSKREVGGKGLASAQEALRIDGLAVICTS